MALNLQGNWDIRFDTKLDGKLEPPFQQYSLTFGPEKNSEFTGHYTDISDPSTFVARVLSSPRGTAISIVQSHPEANYYATYTGYLVTSITNTIQGAYTDLEGNAGDLQLVPSK